MLQIEILCMFFTDLYGRYKCLFCVVYRVHMACGLLLTQPAPGWPDLDPACPSKLQVLAEIIAKVAWETCN